MRYPAVDDLPGAATSTLLGVCAQLSRSRHPGLARWATSVSDALLVRLVAVTTGVHLDGASSAPRPLQTLDNAELDGLHALLLAGAEASDDDSVVACCTRMNELIIADLCRRELERAAMEAKAAAIVAEERRLDCLARRDGLFVG
ncbi:hypothetical protein [Mycobacterium sp.]|uniref:hypothetical protein n=1 Tax=Mycobacterium sp. TaxID=1785 RepID=UPI0031DC465D